VKRAKFFKALADATRLRTLRLLLVREMCVCEVMVALDLTQPTASPMIIKSIVTARIARVLSANRQTRGLS
jgi:predicted transcriptional regulator